MKSFALCQLDQWLTTEGTKDMYLAKEKGEELYNQFASERILIVLKSFFDPIRKVKK